MTTFYDGYMAGYTDGRTLAPAKSAAPYLVFNATKGGGPTFQHLTREAAQREATRLANANPGQDFLVLGSLSATKAPKLQASTRALV